MLSREQAQERLKEVHLENGFDVLVEAIRPLPAKHRTVAFALLNCDAEGKLFDYQRNQDSWKAKAEAGKLLDDATPRERQAIFAVFYPKLAPALETAWQFLTRQVYQEGYARRPFRVVNRPEATRDRRVNWLARLINITQNLRRDVIDLDWLAAWAPHVGYGSDNDIGLLLAAALEDKTPEANALYDALIAMAKGEHEIGSMGRHVTRALLTSSRPEGWEFIEKLLLAAQRQEGLRQVILETADEAHPQAFRRLLRVIRDQKLARFTAVVRAVNVWFGYQWDSVSAGTVNQVIVRNLDMLDNEATREAALRGADGEAAFQALWAIAFDDAHAALKRAAAMLADKRPDKRFAAVTLLGMLTLPEAKAPLLGAMDDDDLRVACAAHRNAYGASGFQVEPAEPAPSKGDDHFARLERLIERLPEKKPLTLKPLIWPWTKTIVERKRLLGELVGLLGQGPIARILPYLDAMDARARQQLAYRFNQLTTWDADTRRLALRLAGDASTWVRSQVLTALATTAITTEEVPQLESYLTRKAADLRRGIVTLLLSQKDADALASADRLLAADNANQRFAGLELLRQLTEGERQATACRERAQAYQEARRKVTKEEQGQLDAILKEHAPTWTLDNALGLMDPAQRTRPTPPKKRNVEFITPAALACIKDFDDFIHANRDKPIKVDTYQGPREELLANFQGGGYLAFPGPDWRIAASQQREKFPGADIFYGWLNNRPKKLRDQDNLELLRVRQCLGLSQALRNEKWREWRKQYPGIQGILDLFANGLEIPSLRYRHLGSTVIQWFCFLDFQSHHLDFLLDVWETIFATIPARELTSLPTDPEAKPDRNYGLRDSPRDWRNTYAFEYWADWFTPYWPSLKPSKEQLTRFWKLLSWHDEPIPGAVRHRPKFDWMIEAYHAGLAKDVDVLDHVLGTRLKSDNYWQNIFESLGELTARKPKKDIREDSRLQAMADRCRERILEIELQRGETGTVASQPATELGALFGLDTLIRLLSALRVSGFHKADPYGRQRGLSKPGVLSNLAAKTYPTEADTPEAFASRMRDEVQGRNIPEECALELAFLAPQWVAHVEEYYGWPGFAEGVWWFFAHMPRGHVGELGVVEEAEPVETTPDDTKKENVSPWEKLIRERTPLTTEERNQGAVDVAWFQRVHQELGDGRWRRLGEAARWGANANNANKALHLGDVLLGKASKRDLVKDIAKKRLKESVRLLGLLPLAEGKERYADLLQRYKILAEYRRYAKGLSSMSKPAAMQAVQIGMENLARTAGYPDPLRLEWAMEAEGLGDLVQGGSKVTVQGVTVTLFLDDDRQPQISYAKGAEELKTIPAALKKNDKIAELLERRADLKRQQSRMRESLENAMCRGDTFTGEELRGLMNHPLLAPMLERLVLVGDGLIGYPAKRGLALKRYDAKLEPVKKTDSLRFAHPHDLFAAKHWHEWQRDCFKTERVQPFKQIFREFYVVTKQEKKEGAMSRRYDGQQVQPRQATALFNQRGWNTTEGIWKTFYDHDLTTSVYFKYGWGTALDVEGWTLEGIEFRKRKEYKPLALDKVPPRVFSEVMRDLDLVVSVAHRGGVDPEASASTVEMRTSLLRETCTLLKIKNYRIQNQHVLIDGKLGDYSIHLGSAVVHRRPGGAICILPIHAQHRGRLFLPFADNDPKTAEVLSKVLLLARDQEIQDPTILEQLR